MRVLVAHFYFADLDTESNTIEPAEGTQSLIHHIDCGLILATGAATNRVAFVERELHECLTELL